MTKKAKPIKNPFLTLGIILDVLKISKLIIVIIKTVGIIPASHNAIGKSAGSVISKSMPKHFEESMEIRNDIPIVKIIKPMIFFITSFYQKTASTIRRFSGF